MKTTKSLIIACTFLWLGFVLAISFMEAWLKFEAPNITIPLGLGIGRLVFTALNLVELTFVVLILGGIILSKSFAQHKQHLLFYLAAVIVILQAVWMLPALDARATDVIAGKEVGTSMLHLYYIVIEFVKVMCLFVFGWKRLKTL